MLNNLLYESFSWRSTYLTTIGWYRKLLSRFMQGPTKFSFGWEEELVKVDKGNAGIFYQY